MAHATPQAALSVVTTTDPIARALPCLLAALSHLAKQQGMEIEVIVVDDLGQWNGSRAKPDPPKLPQYPGLIPKYLKHMGQRGQQSAVLYGLTQATAPVMLTIDPDLYPCVPEIPSMMAMLSDQCWGVHGVRSQRKDTSPVRKIGSFLVNALVRAITGLRTRDIGSPMILFNRRVLEHALQLSGSRANPKLYVYTTLHQHLDSYRLGHGTPADSPSHYSLMRLLKEFLKLLGDSIYIRRAVRRDERTHRRDSSPRSRQE